MTAEYWTKKVYRVDDPVIESLIGRLTESQGVQNNLSLYLSENQNLRKLLKNVF